MNMNIKIRYIFTVIAALLGLCSACTDNVSDPPLPGGNSGITLYVPALNTFATRAAAEDEEELKYTSLFLFAFPTDGSDACVVSLPVDKSPLAFNDTYRTYQIKLDPGKYKLYLIANIYDAAAEVSDLPQTEDALIQELLHTPGDFAGKIPASGLPMSASHSDFFVKKADGTQQSVATDGYQYDGQSESLYAVLSFLYAKITVSAKDAFGNTAGLTDVVFSNLSQQEPLIFRDGFSDYGLIAAVNVPDAEGSATPVTQTFYIPERYVDQSAPESQSGLTFKIGGKKIELPLGEAEGDKEDDVNSVPAADKLRKIVRGTHYKYTVNTLLDITLEVSDWSPEELMVKLQDPVYLDIEEQSYPVVAGEVTEVWFRSDVEDVYIDSPVYHYGDEDLPLYTYEKEYSTDTKEGLFRIVVNDDIPSSEYEKILDEKDRYNFFHIVAGPIHKRIRVTPLTLEYYIDVNPLSIPIDVGLRIASGDYEGSIPVMIRTNYPYVGMALTDDTGWSDIIDLNTDDAYLKLVGPDGAEITGNSPEYISVDTSGEVKYRLMFKGLNTGSEIWKDDKVLKLSVTGSDDMISSEPIPVTVNITPLIHDYTIHFKADGWTAPHIYVYECLEFPADWGGTYSPGNGQPVEMLASKPLGYYAGKRADGEEMYYAALEYSFTGAIAFKGWDVPANLETLYYSNGSPRPFDGYRAQGFYIFNNNQQSWMPNLQDQAKERYSFNMDFCEQHRESIKESCPQCGSAMNRLWPGIMMRDEGDGWYEFVLTGIATPGRALIMFADGHTGGTKRYPGVAEVGIPLFDYPSKEGWLRFNGIVSDRINNQFSSVKPSDP